MAKRKGTKGQKQRSTKHILIKLKIE